MKYEDEHVTFIVNICIIRADARYCRDSCFKLLFTAFNEYTIFACLHE